MRKVLFLLICLCGHLAAEPTCLYIVRHGQTDWNVEKRLQGQSDIPLNEAGRGEAAALKEELDTVPFDACMASDLQRASETARILTQGRSLTIAIDARLREYNFGALEGRLLSEISKEDFLALTETQDKMQERVFAALDEIVAQHPGQTVLVVTHGGVMKNIFTRLFSTTTFVNASVHNLGMLCLEIEGDKWRIKQLHNIELTGNLPKTASSDKL